MSVGTPENAPLINSSSGRSSVGTELTTRIDIKTLPPNATFLRMLGVNYVHLKTADEGDMYLTEHGLPFVEHLRPQNWYEPHWFKAKRERLHGTSMVYRVPTQPVPGHPVKSMDLVVKWSRVGQDVPLDTFTFNKAINAEFNTPFEEFSLVEELRSGNYGPPSVKVFTQKPLAIYVPPERMQLWQTGRSKDKILTKIARHPGVEIDILRSYILLYGWIRGIDAVEAYRGSYFEEKKREQCLLELTQKVNHDLEQKGFLVADNKPTHFIVRMKSGQPKRRKDDQILYAMVDYELLARTPAHEEAVKASLRSRYLLMMKDRFNPELIATFPPHLKPAKVMDVPYTYGRAESTNGVLWVVGSNPELFSYFLPERWRSKQVRLSQTNQTYYTQTKDRIHLVWKVSRVGELPPGDLSEEGYEGLLMQGYNSPFEEFALAVEMNRKGIPTAYPRAIYMTGQQSELAGCIVDERRYERFKAMLSPERQPVLRLDRDYITIWGYWRGLEDDQAHYEVGYWIPIDAARAAKMGLITPQTLEELIGRQRETLAKAGFQDSTLKGDHILLSYIPDGTIKRNVRGEIELRQCNFEMVRRL